MPFHTLDQLPQTTEETHFVPRSGSLEYPGFSGARYEGQWCNQRRFGKVIFKTVLTINWFLSIINEEIHSRNHFFFLAEISWQPKAHGELLAFEVWTLAKSDDKCIFQVNSLLSILEPCQPGHWKKKKRSLLFRHKAPLFESCSLLIAKSVQRKTRRDAMNRSVFQRTVLTTENSDTCL